MFASFAASAVKTFAAIWLSFRKKAPRSIAAGRSKIASMREDYHARLLRGAAV
jgi:hypothetical protein